MADFNKQYHDLGLIDWYDFDIMDEFNRCKDGYYVACICEGFGSLAVMNDKGTVKLAFAIADGIFEDTNPKPPKGRGTPIVWKTLTEVEEKFKK